MRLQVLDESIRTACQECTLCCTQSLRVLVKVEKAHMLDTYDFSKYPQLAGKQYFKKSTDGREDVYEIAKHEDMHCIFCDTDDLCIIHKELGPEAKPRMCRQFPILESRTPVDDRISASYACPAVQAFDGEALTEKASDIAELVPLTDKPMDFDARVPLDATFDLSWIESNALFDRVRALFDPDRHADLWTRFGDVLALLVAVRAYKDDAPENTGQNELIDMLRSNEPLPNTPEIPEIRAWENCSQVPMPVRFLFAATMYPDTVPADSVASAGLFKRLSLIPKLISLSKLSGAYASRVLGRNVAVGKVMQREVSDHLGDGATKLLLRYFRSRFWQRFLAGTRLSVIAGMHQHIQDLNAIIFYARAEAMQNNTSELTDDLIGQALSRVECYIANQQRMYDYTLKGWLKTQLNNPALAFQSLRLMALKRAVPTNQQSTETAPTQQPSTTE